MWNPDDPLARWIRQPGEAGPNESKRANQALWDYAELGRARTLQDLADRYTRREGTENATLAPTLKINTLKHWSHLHQWQDRIRRYDEIQLARQAKLREEAALTKAAEEEARWSERRDQLRESEWRTAQALIDKAELMLRWPLQRTEIRENQTVVHPARWQMVDAAKMLDLASKLGRLAVGLEPDRRRVQFENMSDDDLIAYIQIELGISGGGADGGEAPQDKRGADIAGTDSGFPQAAGRLVIRKRPVAFVIDDTAHVG
jgi:hypothetical protein